jgi:hypothetical protein
MDIKPILDDINLRLSTHSSFGLFLSGGFDSTVLAYTVFMMLHESRRNVTLKIYTVPRFDDSVTHVHRITKWLTEIFNEQQFEMITCGNPHLHHSQQVSSGVLEVAGTGICDTIILGDTKNPDEVPNGPVRIVAKPKIYFQPFINTDKRATLLIAAHYNILDEISTISHTCTQSISLRCTKCWQCRERAWAFSALGLEDRGSM